MLTIIYMYIISFILYHVSSISDQNYQKYTFYYETYQYSLNPDKFDVINDDPDDYLKQITPFDEFGLQNKSGDAIEQSISIDISIDDLNINILKSSGTPYVLNVASKQHQQKLKSKRETFSFKYDNYDELTLLIYVHSTRERRR